MSRRTLRIAGAVAGALVGLALGGAAGAVSETCREWRREHGEWKARAVRLALGGATPRELDEALFEMLQREAYLTSCELSVEGARAELVGWRLVGRPPDEYGSAVLESVLAQGGFDLDLRRRLEGALAGGVEPVRPATAARRR